jgi:SAM-dependent methyltransferase
MGQGRNSLYLTREGWDVTGIEMSSVAIEQAKAQASQLGVRYTTIVADIDRWDFGRSQWDLIAAIYEPDFRWVRQICDSLKPSGLFVRENYVLSKEENEPLKNFLELRITRYEDRIDEPDYEPAGEHAKPQRVQRMVAQKQ